MTPADLDRIEAIRVLGRAYRAEMRGRADAAYLAMLLREIDAFTSPTSNLATYSETVRIAA